MITRVRRTEYPKHLERQPFEVLLSLNNCIDVLDLLHTLLLTSSLFSQWGFWFEGVLTRCTYFMNKGQI